MFRAKLSVLLAIATTTVVGAEQMREPGAMLREGTWISDAGAYSVPQALAATKPSDWPVEGWFRLTIGGDQVVSEPVPVPARGMPAFLRAIVEQLETQTEPAKTGPASAADAAEPPNRIYLRVPGTRLITGSAPAYVFKNGTPSIRPALDHRYELKLGDQAFAFSVRNGLRGRHGEAYGNGAQYTIEYDGNTYEYSVGEFGWDSSISAIADLDGDGKPDFIITVGGNNSGIEAILLSSKAKPGKNPATATLFQIGC